MKQPPPIIKTCPDCKEPFTTYLVWDGGVWMEPVCCWGCRYLLKIEIAAQLLTYRPWETHETAEEWIERMGIKRERRFWRNSA